MRIFLILALLAVRAFGQTAESLDFLQGLPDFREARTMLPEYLNRRVFSLLDARQEKIRQIRTPEDLAARRAYVRERMLAALGGLPSERTPLNAKVVATLDRDGYRIEKVVFESQPRFYVVANLYVPKTGKPPYPAVLFPLGHEAGAKAHETWQYMLVSLAKRGYVCLAWDPVGQGERVQLFDPDLGESKVVRSTTEHTIVAIQALLVGDNLARYTIWDGMRALDYLLSRPEVDPQRVACTGNSGGGTHTAYLSALDDRIHVAAPSCYLTSWRRLVQTIGPQDGEQCLPPWIADGLDHPDFVLAFGLKPYLILSAIRDFFSITGARETYSEAQKVYSAVGAAEKIKMVEADDGHGYSKPRRLAAYQWFARWLKGQEDNEPEPPVKPESEETLNVTPTGQVATSFGGETVHSLNLQRLRALRGRPNPKDLPAQVRKLLRTETRREPPVVRPFGTIARSGYRIEKFLYEPETGIFIPALLYLPDRPGRLPAVFYVHGRGKSATGRAGGELEQLALAGNVVLAADLRGLGETAYSTGQSGSDFPRFFGDYHSTMKTLLLDKPLVAMRVEDIAAGLEVLSARPEVDPERIAGYGHGVPAVPLLHAAVLDGRLKKLVLEGMVVSYEAVVTAKIHRNVFENVIRGVLRSYDLPDLAQAVAPREVHVVNPVDPLGRAVALAEARRVYGGWSHVRVADRAPAPPW
jgi:cephalosporin-C deacetylase-like acetyl esterase